jgi:hypothetical protein
MTDTQLTIGWIIYLTIGVSVSYLAHYINRASYVFEWFFITLFWPLVFIFLVGSTRIGDK